MLAFINLVALFVISLRVANQSVNTCDGTQQFLAGRVGRRCYKLRSKRRLQFSILGPAELVTGLRFWQWRLLGCLSDSELSPVASLWSWDAVRGG